jgi:hypothetical protein
VYKDVDMGGNADPQPLVGSRRSFRGGLWMIGMAVLLFAVIAFLQRDRDPSRTPAVAQSPVPTEALCSGMRDFGVEGIEVEHVQGDVDYPSSPPFAGSHHPMPLPASPQVVARDGAPEHVVERAVHNLEHGYVVVWYDARATDAQVQAVGDAVREVGERKVLVVPWSRDELDGPPFTLSAWGHLQSCMQPDAASVRAFWDQHGGTNGDAPERNAP